MLDLSTAHWPSSTALLDACGPKVDGEDRCLGTERVVGPRVVEHEHGAIVFVGPLDWSSVPKWLVPIMRLAVTTDCILINFDQAADVSPKFPSYEW